MVQQYRKKPVVIEAVQFTGTNKFEIEVFIGTELKSHYKNDNPNDSTPIDGLRIPTLEGNMIASVGDYIIKGIKGEFYPCRSDIFEATYEIVNQ